MRNYSIPSSVAVAAWAALLALVAAYTGKAYLKTAKNLPAPDFEATIDRATDIGLEALDTASE